MFAFELGMEAQGKIIIFCCLRICCFCVGDVYTGGTLYTQPTCQDLNVFPGIESGSHDYTKKGPAVQPLDDMGGLRLALEACVSKLEEGWDFSFRIAHPLTAARPLTPSHGD